MMLSISISDIMKINYEKVNFSHYSNQGTQISLDTFIFNNEKLMIRPKFVCYLVNEKKKGKEFVAYVSRLPTSIVLKVFSEQLSIQRNIKYPSILNYYGYNERNFKHDPYPVLIPEFCKRGTLSEFLSFQNNCELYKKGFSDWNNTKNKIIAHLLFRFLPYTYHILPIPIPLPLPMYEIPYNFLYFFTFVIQCNPSNPIVYHFIHFYFITSITR